MTPFDLTDFTNTSEKIPESYLNPTNRVRTEISSLNIAVAYVIDLAAVGLFSSVAVNFLTFSLRSLVVASQLQPAFSNIPYSFLHLTLMPLIFTTYFFSSCFLNDGQSYGMKLMNLRIELGRKDLRTSLVWGVFSSSVLTTFGLGFLLMYRKLQQDGWGTFNSHDHLYSLLLQERDLSPVNLLDLTSTKETRYAEEATKAAA